MLGIDSTILFSTLIPIITKHRSHVCLKHGGDHLQCLVSDRVLGQVDVHPQRILPLPLLPDGGEGGDEAQVRGGHGLEPRRHDGAEAVVVSAQLEPLRAVVHIERQHAAATPQTCLQTRPDVQLFSVYLYKSMYALARQQQTGLLRCNR